MYGLIFFLLIMAILLDFEFKGELSFAKKSTHISFTANAAKQKRVQINADFALNRLEKLWLKIDSLLKKINKNWNYLYKVAAICFFSGLVCGVILFRDFFLSVVSGVAFVPLSYLYLIFRTMGARRKEIEDLENTMSMITNAYLSNDDIVRAFQVYVTEKNRYVDERFIDTTPFDEFLSDVLLINPNIERALVLLDRKIDNWYFHEWIKKLILCNKDRQMKFALIPIINAMNDQKGMQIESDTAMVAAWRNYLLTVGAMFSIIPILKVLNDVWFGILTQTVIGKGFVVAMILTALLTAGYVMKINKPIEA